MLQMYVPNVLVVSDTCLMCVYLDVAMTIQVYSIVYGIGCNGRPDVVEEMRR
jgi:hypothetical protein